ncbi:hypothetical protein LTS15_007864 [Exophiala xenobiotica]|nr:hypothetical protein LTS15_007864 [Exophiala xenobiotica]
MPHAPLLPAVRQQMLEPIVFRLSYLSLQKVEQEYRRGASDFCKILGHTWMYEHCVRYIAEAKLQVLGEALADRTHHDDKKERVSAASVPCQGRQSEPVRSGSFTVHIIETIDWNDEVDGEDSNEDSDVEDIEISSDDGWDELEVRETETK